MSKSNIKFTKTNLIESNKGVQKQRCKLTDFDDSIYDALSSKVNIDDKNKIADFLDLFYYFIICYSKMCFKKHALWESKYVYFTHYKTKKAYIIGNTFNYQLANDTNAQNV